MKFLSIALVALLGTSLIAPTLAQPTPTPTPAQGMGMGKGGKMSFNKDSTPGWKLMTPEERAAYGEKMHATKTYDECKAMQDEQHAMMELRAKDKGVKLPVVRANGCDRMKARGLLK